MVSPEMFQPVSSLVINGSGSVGIGTADRVATMKVQQLIELFARYGFVDQIGHPLTHCADFLDLVSRATGTPADALFSIVCLLERIAELEGKSTLPAAQHEFCLPQFGSWRSNAVPTSKLEITKEPPAQKEEP